MGSRLKNPLLFMEFSESFVKSRNLTGMNSKPRSSKSASMSRSAIAGRLEDGFGFYKKFEYNKNLPVVEKFVLREESLAKSLRYSFIETTKISLIGSVGKNCFLFPVESESELSRICSILRYSRNKSLAASLSHLESIGGFYPNEKLELSEKFIRSAVFDDGKIKKIRLKCFPFPDAESKVAEFLINLGAFFIKPFPLKNDSLFVEGVLPDYKPKITALINHSYITEISEPEILRIKEHYLRHEDISPDCVMERDTDSSYPKVGIIDSGVAENSLLKRWETGRELFVDPELIDSSHGTFVTGRALSSGESFGGTEYLDVTVMPGRKGTPPDLMRLAEILNALVPKYADTIKIWNLSLGTDITADNSISLFAYTLDRLQQENDVLFVLPTGNFDPLRSDGPQSDDTITIPAESLLSLTVGSVSHIDTNLTPLHSPSLFSRKGRGAFSSVKPELVHYGGTHEKRFGRYLVRGVFSIGKRNEIAEDTGTSHASPVVAAMAARIYGLLGKAASIDSVKAIMIHRAQGTGGDISYTGWGLPESPDEVAYTEKSSISIIHTGIYKSGSFIETPPVTLPFEMFKDGRLTGKVRITLSYRPPISISFAGYYTCINLKVSLGYMRNGKWTALVTDKDLRFAPSDRDDRESFGWLPLKDYTAALNVRNAPSELIMRITASKRDFWKEHSQVPYAAVLSFESGEDEAPLSVKETVTAAKGFLIPLKS